MKQPLTVRLILRIPRTAGASRVGGTPLRDYDDSMTLTMIARLGDWVETADPENCEDADARGFTVDDCGTLLQSCPGIVTWIQRVNALPRFKAMPGF